MQNNTYKINEVRNPALHVAINFKTNVEWQSYAQCWKLLYMHTHQIKQYSTLYKYTILHRSELRGVQFHKERQIHWTRTSQESQIQQTSELQHPIGAAIGGGGEEASPHHSGWDWSWDMHKAVENLGERVGSMTEENMWRTPWQCFLPIGDLFSENFDMSSFSEPRLCHC